MPERMRLYFSSLEALERRQEIERDWAIHDAEQRRKELQPHVDKLRDKFNKAEEVVANAEKWLKRQTTKKSRQKWASTLESAKKERAKIRKELDSAESELHDVDRLIKGEKQTASNDASNVPVIYGGKEFRGMFTDGVEAGKIRDEKTYFRVGEILRFSRCMAEENTDSLEVFQVVDEQSIFAFWRGAPRQSIHPMFMVRGIDVKTIREKNLESCHEPGPFIVSGTHRYETRRGTLNTVFLLERIDIEEVRKWWPAYREKNGH